MPAKKVKDPELMKDQAERNKAEIKLLIARLEELLSVVPPGVVNGSQQTAIAFKDIAHKGYMLLNSKHSPLKDVRWCVNSLEQYFKAKQ